MIEVAGTGVIVIDFRPGDYRTGFNQTMQATSEIQKLRRPPPRAVAAMQRAWTGSKPTCNRRRRPRARRRSAPGAPPRPQRHRALGDASSRRVLAPLLARLAPLLRRAVTARYFGCF
jgi:hypothetical protein